MNEDQTRLFVEAWNKENDSAGVGSMVYVSPDVVSWNEYDAPTVVVSQFVRLASVPVLVQDCHQCHNQGNEIMCADCVWDGPDRSNFRWRG